MRLVVLYSLFFYYITTRHSITANRLSDQPLRKQRKMVGAYSRVTDFTKDDQLPVAAQLAVDKLPESDQSYSFMTDKDGFEITTTPARWSFEIVRAYEQVVAGKNYRLILLLQEKEGEEEDSETCVGAFGVTIYNRFGDMSITKWDKELSCAVAMAALESKEDMDLDKDVADEENGA